MYEFLEGSTVLITGGTGSFGKKCAEIILKNARPRKLIIFSRDEGKQEAMSRVVNGDLYDCKVSYYIGDVRDNQRLHRAFHGVDFVIHAAALKQVPAAEYNPDEAIKTNITGALNVINAAIDQRVKKIIVLSTDKAVKPINLYGATKLCAEKLFVAGNSYVGDAGSLFSAVRYGNVVGSRGSVIPLLIEKKKTGVIPLTDARMTRFWITLEQGVDFVLKALETMDGGEIFVPKIPSMKIVDLANVIAPDCKIEFIGIRPGEKLDECLLTEEEVRHTIEFEDFFVVTPQRSWWKSKKWDQGKNLPEDFCYTSDSNGHWLTEEELKDMLAILK